MNKSHETSNQAMIWHFFSLFVLFPFFFFFYMSAIRRIRTSGKGIKQFGAWMTRMKIQSFLKNTRCSNNLSDEYFALQAKKEEIVEQYFYCFFGIFSCVSNIHILTRWIIRIEEEENLHISMTARAGREW